MKAWILPVAVALACAGGCGEAAPASGPAAECAEVVRIYKDLNGPVGVVGASRETSEGRVRIEYEGMDAINAPVKGSAACSFDVGGGGALQLLSASVDGIPLDGPSIEALRGDLAER